MQFDKKTHKVDIKTLNKDEAKAFILFLESEILRHQEDIKDIDKIISKVKAEFKI